MPNPRKTMTTKRLPLIGATAGVPLDPLRPGMPALDHIHSTIPLAPKRGRGTYHILRTIETDNYETSAPAVEIPPILRTKGPLPAAKLRKVVTKKPPPVAGDVFQGKARKAAKLSKAQAPTQKYKDLKDLIASLAPESKMIQHQPRISTAPTSNRVKEEQRNVSVSAFLYAASHEADNDFHLIIGRDHTLAPEMYMTMEVSGLPPPGTPPLADLNTARSAFKKYFGTKLPAFTYDFYHPPIPVQIEGSLFFDMTHATGGRPGPPSLKSRMPVIWEVHPVTKIKLG